MKRIFLFTIFFSLVGCNAKVTDRSDQNLQARVLTAMDECAAGRCPCTTPVGDVTHGAKITAYTNGTPSCEKGCGAYAKVLTCNNGTFDQETTDLSFKCEVQACPNCTLGANLIRSGATIKAFSKSEVGCSESCEDFKQERTCIRGVLSGSDSFNQVSCKPKVCRCELPDASAFISLGGSQKLYSTQQAECGTSCNANYLQERFCVSSGPASAPVFSLNGNASFRYTQCSERSGCSCTLPDNSILNNGMTQVLSTAMSVECGQSCSLLASITVLCKDGKLYDNANKTRAINFLSASDAPYKFRCEAKQCASCSVPGTGLSIANGDSRDFFQSASPACDAGGCKSISRKCENGVLSGNASYLALACAPRTCSCVAPDGSGNRVPVGNTAPFYSAAKAQCGKRCADITKPQICTEVPPANAAADYTYLFKGTDPTFGIPLCAEATGCSCALPGDLKPIADGKAVLLTSLNPVPCGTTCDQTPSLKVQCNNGQLIKASDGSAVDISAAGFAYKYLCAHSTCTDCKLPGYTGTIASNGAPITLYSKQVMGCSDQPTLHTYQFACENGALTRNGTAYNPTQDPNPVATWYSSYRTECAGCPFPDKTGSILPIGAKKNFYAWSGSVVNGCGKGCKSQERTCLPGGVLDGNNEFTMPSCDNNCSLEGGGAPPRMCLLRWQNSYVTPDSRIPMWNKRVVGCGDSCQNHFKLSKCELASGAFDAPYDYMYNSCTETCP